MEKKEFICISCPVGCTLHVWEEDGEIRVEGNTCPRGKRYGIQEYTAPVRTVTSSVPVRYGDMEMVSVKTAGSVPKEKIPEVLTGIHGLRVSAPVRIGQVLLENVADTGINVVATRNVNMK